MHSPLTPLSNEKEDMSVLIVGSGAREAALAWSLSKSKRLKNVFVVPGNAGIGKNLSEKISSVDISIKDNFSDLLKFALEKEVCLIVPGSENVIVGGIKNVFESQNIPCFCPGQNAAILEESKAFSKEFMTEMGIPTAKFATFSDYSSAEKYVEDFGPEKIVIKVSGLASGKGVFLPNSMNEAKDVLDRIFVKCEFGKQKVVVEERLQGEEVSVICISDGYTAIQFPAAQDHKRIFDGDNGPNTGGMGTYSPVPFYSESLRKKVQKDILERTIAGMRKLKAPFIGALFIGLMITNIGPYVLEYNVRFGDPEAQVILPLLEDSCDIFEIFMACVNGYLDSMEVKFKKDFAAANVVLASGGYPGSFKKGLPIVIHDPLPSNTIIFHGGTSLKDGRVITAGGRVLSVVSLSNKVETALSTSYEAIKRIEFEGMYYRKDIGMKCLKPRHTTYEESGVSIREAEVFVNEIKEITKSTRRLGTCADIGGFGGIFDLKEAMFQDPILVSSTDGVGTKLCVARDMGIYNTIGIDLVAMNVNDIITMGAEPLFFLDYYSCGKLNSKIATQIMMGIKTGCIESGCAILGGETSEMPSVYSDDEFDLAGFVVGARERSLIYPKDTVVPGDLVIGLKSSGIHSNGFSLVRYLLEQNKIEYTSKLPFDTTTKVYEELLKPTKIYVKSILPLLKNTNIVKAVAHITGGGIPLNLNRVLPQEVKSVIDATKWKIPKIFLWLKTLGNIRNEELSRTFNCGIGMVAVIAKEHINEATKLLLEGGEETCIIGTISEKKSDPPVVIENMDVAWGPDPN